MLLDLPGKLALVIQASSGQVAPPLVEVMTVLLQHGPCAAVSLESSTTTVAYSSQAENPQP